MSQLPAVVTITDLPIGTTLSGAELFEAVQTSGGVANSIQVTLNQISSAVLTTLPYGSPTAQVGTIAIAGAATSVMRSDAAPAINLGMAPTWTAVHNFNASGTAIIANNGGIEINPSAGLTQAFNITQSLSGNFTSANFNANLLTISSDNANFSSGFGVGAEFNYVVGGSSMQGGREAIQANVTLATTSSSSSLNRNYVGIAGVAVSLVNDNGVGTAAASAAGALFGGNFVGGLINGAATAFASVSGAEFNSFIVTGASAWGKTLAQFSADPRDKVQGAVVDTMLWLYNQSTSNPGWNNGILFDGSNVPWPISTTGTIIKTLGAQTAAVGIDFSATNFSTAAIKTKNFTVDPLGVVNATAYQIGGKNLVLFDASDFLFGNQPGTGFSFVTNSSLQNAYRANQHIFQSPTGVTQYAQIATSGGLSVGTTGDPGTGNIIASTYFNNSNQNIGGQVLLNTISPNNVATAGDTTSFTAAFRSYLVTLENIVPANNNVIFQAQVATSGVAFVSGNYVSAATVDGSAIVSDTSTTTLLLSGIRSTTTVGNSTTYGVNGSFRLTNPLSTTFRKHINGDISYLNGVTSGTANFCSAQIAGYFDGNNNALTGIQFSFSGGNIQTGTIKIYGLP